VPFSLRLSAQELLPALPSIEEAIRRDPRWQRPPWETALREAWVVIQGRIDCVFCDADGRWSLIDWKTDHLTRGMLAERVAAYAWQMRIYREAVRRLWGEPGDAWLVFLALGEAVRWTE